MAVVNFARHSYKARSLPLSAQRLVNLFAEQAPEDAKSPVSVIGGAGLKSFAEVGVGQIRGSITMDGVLFVVAGVEVYTIDSSGTGTLIGSLSIASGRVRMSHNGTQILIVETDGSGYIATTSSVALITDADFPTVDDVTYQDGYFIVTERSTGNIYISALLDGTSWNAADFTNVDGNPDDNVGLISDGSFTWVMGETSTQIYYNSGNADFPFDVVIGALHKKGCIARDTITQLEGIITWLSDKRRIYMSSGHNVQRISTYPLEEEWSKYTTVDDAFSFTYVQGGHEFMVLTFPTEGSTFVYDFTSGLWHERSSGDTNSRWKANSHALAYGKNYVGDVTSGKIWELDIDTYTDDGDEIIREAVMPPIFSEQKRITFDSVLIDIEAGTGITTGQGIDPQAMLSWSDDGGKTFGNVLERSMGKIGEYKARAVWRRLGQSRQRVFKFAVSDPVKVVVNGAFIDYRVGLK